MISAFRQANENPSALKPYRAAGYRAQIMGNSPQLGPRVAGAQLISDIPNTSAPPRLALLPSAC
jgi:hypothetical protein